MPPSTENQASARNKSFLSVASERAVRFYRHVGTESSRRASLHGETNLAIVAKRLLGFGRSYEFSDWHRYDIGHSPSCRNAPFAKRRFENLRDDSADDRCDPALAIEHRRSRRTVINGKTVIPVVHFEQRSARKPAFGCVLHEPATYGAQLAIWIGESDEAIFRHERRHSDRNALRRGSWILQFKHGQFFRACAGEALNADRHRVAVSAILNGENLPFPGRKPHRADDMLDGDKRSRRLEPASPLNSDQVGLRLALGIVEISRNAYCRMRQQCGINAARIGARLNGSAQRENQRIASPSVHFDSCPILRLEGWAELGVRQVRFAAYPQKSVGVCDFFGQESLFCDAIGTFTIQRSRA